MQNFTSLAQKLWICTPNPNFLLFWLVWLVNSICGQAILVNQVDWTNNLVNSICDQTKGQIRISIAEMDSLGSITYI